MDKLKCEIVRDLLPNYVEKLTCDVTNECMDAHIKECEECREICNKMQYQMKEDPVPEAKNLGRFLNKIKIRYVKIIILLLGIIGITTCFIVDLAMNFSLTWSFIVLGSVILAYIPGYVLLTEKKNTILKILLIITILIIPYLYLLQEVLEKNYSVNGIWFTQYACPITIIWLLVVWVTYIAVKIFKLNIFFSIAFLFLLAIPANVQTNIVAGDLAGWSDFSKRFMQFGFGYFAGMIICMTIGLLYHNKYKK